MAVGVVVLFEPVDIQQNNCDGCIIPASPPPLLLQGRIEAASIGQVRQAVRVSDDLQVVPGNVQFPLRSDQLLDLPIQQDAQKNQRQDNDAGDGHGALCIGPPGREHMLTGDTGSGDDGQS